MDQPKVKTHVAIMKQSWGLTQKILNGQKTIESRWYKNQYKPWKEIQPEDTVYFKDSGKPVCLKAIVDKVLRFYALTPLKVEAILREFGEADGIDSDNQYEQFYNLFRNKRYCLLIFLRQVEKVIPFDIDKRGYGAMASWLVLDNINQVKKGDVEVGQRKG